MNKANRWLQNYLIYALPFVIVTMIWATFRELGDGPKLPNGGILVESAFWEFFSWNLIIWFSLLAVFICLIVFHTKTREQVIRRIANIKERDEREEYVTAKASRAAFMASLSLLLLLLFISIFNVNITKYPPTEAMNGKTGILTIGLHFSLLDEPKAKTDSQGKVLFESKDIPLSKPAILLGLILWQLGSFRWSSRKLLREET